MNDNWQTFVVGIAGAAIGAMATIGASSLGYLNKDRELDIRMVSIALTILSGKIEGEKSEPARKFALRALEKFSGVDIPEPEFDVWVKEGIVPKGDDDAWEWMRAMGYEVKTRILDDGVVYKHIEKSEPSRVPSAK